MAWLQTTLNWDLASDKEILSPIYLSVLAVETLAIAVRENSIIKGIKLGENETKFL